MLGKLVQWWRKRSVDRSRLIFEFWDGQQVARRDPLLLERRIAMHPEWRPDVHCIEANDGNQQAYELTLRALREIFEVEAYDGTKGMTEWEVMGLFTDYLSFMEEVKKNMLHLQTLPVSTESTSNASSEPTTNDSSDST